MDLRSDVEDYGKYSDLGCKRTMTHLWVVLNFAPRGIFFILVVGSSNEFYPGSLSCSSLAALLLPRPVHTQHQPVSFAEAQFARSTGQEPGQQHCTN